MVKPRLKQTDDGSILTSSMMTEWSAFTTRRDWVSIFEKYFSLSKNNDYEIEVNKIVLEDVEFYEVNCNFVSPNAQYTFWKLLNNRAIDAEIALGLK